ncbi:hypothetical protein QTO34_012079, partial [Cnephaeus nilssonii]
DCGPWVRKFELLTRSFEGDKLFLSPNQESQISASMAPLKKRRNTPKLPLALNPQKSKDVLAVLAERNQPIVPVGAWVEPASPHSSENTAYTAAYIIEEELKEQARKKQEALKRFQRQAKHRVNQRIRIRKKQQLQKSYEEVSSKSLMMGIEDRENQNQLLQHALALKKTMKQARYQLASFKTMSQKYAAVFPHDTRKSFSTHQEPDSEESSSITIDKKGREKLFCQNQQGFSSEEKNKEFSRVQKAQFKNPLYTVIEEEQLSKLHLQDILPETQDYLSEAPGNLLETQGDLTGVQCVELEAQNIEPHSQAFELAGQAMEDQVVESKAQAIERKVHVVKIEPQGLMLEAQNIEPEDGNMLEVQDFLSPNQAFLPKDQSILPNDQNIPLKCQDQRFLRRDQHVFPKDQDIQPKYQDQHFLRKDQHVFPKDQDIQPKYQDQDFIPKYPDQHFIHKDEHIVAKDQNSLLKFQHQHFLPREHCVLTKDQRIFSKEQNTLCKSQDQDFLPRYQKVRFKETYSVINEKGRDDFCLAGYQSPTPKVQDQVFIRDQKILFKVPYYVINEKWRDYFSLAGYQSPTPKVQDQAFIRDQVEWNKRAINEKEVLDFRHSQQLKVRFKETYSVINEKGRDDFCLAGYQSPTPKVQDQAFIREQKVRFKEPHSDINEKRRDGFSLAGYQSPTPKVQFQACIRDQNMFLEQPSSFLREVRVRDEFPPEYHHYINLEVQDQASPGDQVEQKTVGRMSFFKGVTETNYLRFGLELIKLVSLCVSANDHKNTVYDKYQSGWNTEFQTPLGLQFEVNQEEDKKERQKRYLRYRRLFMEIEREKVKEQQRQKEYRKRIEK